MLCVSYILQAMEEKEKGNEAYKNKDFEVAHQHYDKALQLDPTNLTFLTNKAGTHVKLGLFIYHPYILSFEDYFLGRDCLSQYTCT